MNSLVSKLRQFLSWLYYEHEWESLEILAIGVVVLIVLLLIIRHQRKRAIRRLYSNQLRETSPVIGVNLGDPKRSDHGIKNLKKKRLTFVPESREKDNKSEKKTEPSENFHEQIKQLQYEIVKRKQSEKHLDQRVANLTADNEQLRREIAEYRQDKEHPSQEVAETPATDEKIPPGVAQKEQAKQDPSQETAETPAAYEKLQPEVAEKKQAEQDLRQEDIKEPVEKKSHRGGRKYDDLHRVVDGVKQKLCRKCNEWKPESEFHKNASCKDGLAGSCKVCKARAARLYRQRWKAEKNTG